MRRVIAIEGQKYIDDRIIEKGALWVAEDGIPVSVSFDWSKVAGYAHSFERDDETGECSMEIELFDEFKELEDESLYEASIFCQPIHVHKPDLIDKTQIVSHGQIRGVAIIGTAVSARP